MYECEEKKGYKATLYVSKETKKLVMTEGIKEYRRHHPEMAGVNITQNMIVRHLYEFYIDPRGLNR